MGCSGTSFTCVFWNKLICLGFLGFVLLAFSGTSWFVWAFWNKFYLRFLGFVLIIPSCELLKLLLFIQVDLSKLICHVLKIFSKLICHAYIEQMVIFILVFIVKLFFKQLKVKIPFYVVVKLLLKLLNFSCVSFKNLNCSCSFWIVKLFFKQLEIKLFYKLLNCSTSC